jgi:hypothetical protein
MVIELTQISADIRNAATKGNYDCALIMLETVHDALKDSSDESLRYLRQCIDDYLMGEPFARSFNLQNRPRGRRRDRAKMLRDLGLAVAVKNKIESTGCTALCAFEEVEAEMNMSVATIKKAYYQYRRYL